MSEQRTCSECGAAAGDLHRAGCCRVQDPYDQEPLFGSRFPKALAAVERVMVFGDNKHGVGRGWARLTPQRHMRHAVGHLEQHQQGQISDDETGESHLAHAAARALMALESAL